MLRDAAPAQGYVHEWTCSRDPGAICLDYTGQPYNPWYEIYGSLSDSTISLTVCAYGYTEAGNARSGSGCFNNNWHAWACIGYYGVTPESRGRVWWGNAGGARNILGKAWTSSPPRC